MSDGGTAMKYRKKPIEIEARQATREDMQAVAEWCGGTYFPANKIDYHAIPIIVIDTLEGPMTAYPNVWVAKGVKGEFYPIRPDIFDETYELVEVGEDSEMREAFRKVVNAVLGDNE